jgi:hypothetical protein
MSSGRDCGSGINARNGGDALVAVNFGGPVIKSREGSGEPDGASRTENSDDEYDVAEFLADAVVVDIATKIIDSFATGIGTVLREVDIYDPMN